jgi:hypothetical protein
MKIELTKEEAQLVIGGLGKLPLEVVGEVYSKITKQYQDKYTPVEEKPKKKKG